MSSHAEVIAEFRARSKRSGELSLAARQWMPSACTSSSSHQDPHPLVIRAGSGCRIEDADGRTYLDVTNQFTSLVHGHSHPGVVAAIREALERGTGFGAPEEGQFELARMLCERIPSVERVRFCASGSEATELAMRVARVHTGRARVVKMEGGYHGNHAMGELSMVAVPGRCGPPEAPRAVAVDASRPEPLEPDLLLARFNDGSQLERVLDEAKGEVAAVILEPMMGASGMIPPEPGYLQAVRESTRAHGALLIFDEVVSLRLGIGGLQSRVGVTPDLTAMGKLIGGGLPIGALGGRADILSCFEAGSPRPVWHATTFGGHPLSVAAGAATLKALDAEAIAHLDRLGAATRERVKLAFCRAGIRGQVSGLGSLLLIHFGSAEIRDARDSLQMLIEAGRVPHLFQLEMLRRGVFLPARLLLSLSTPMSDREVEEIGSAVEASLETLRPLIAAEVPLLIQ